MPRDHDNTRRPPRGPRGAGRSAGEGRPGGKKFGAKSFGDKKVFGGRKPGAKAAFGDNKPRGDRPFGERKGAGKGPYTARPAADRPRSDRPGAAKGERFGGDRPRPRFDRDAGPPRSRDDRPERAARKEFTPRGERGGEDRPRFKPREDRGGEKSFAPRGERRDARPAGRFADKKFGDKRPFAARGADAGGFKREGFRKDDGRPRSGGFRKDGDRPPRAPRKEFTPRGERGAEDRSRFKPREERGGERSFAPRTERPRRDEAERPRFSRPRDERGDRSSGSERPPRRFDRRRDAEAGPSFDRPRAERSTFARPRQDRTAWQEHPRSEGTEGGPRSEEGGRTFVKRPAFGGRGAYRERSPEKERRRPPPPNPSKTGERIAKRLARAGLCSRRDAEEWITQGRVAVNGRVLTSPALDVTERDTITVDGKPLPERERTRLFLYHKPRGLMTTHADPEGRPTVFDNLPAHLPRLISVGRLDFNTEGLLLLTNDGGLARALELPETGWLRRYRVRAHGAITQPQLDALRGGVEVEGVKYGPIEATLEREQGDNVWITFAIREGKNREVRNVLAHLGLEVNRLIRISYGPFQLAELPEGEVEEVRTRVLREQLGDKIAGLAHADFHAPVSHAEAGEDAPSRADKPAKPRGRAVIADRKGRRVLVERSGESDGGEARPYRRPKRTYHGKRDRKPKED